ncbi:alanine racemase [Oceanobacillus piezotolerans]|uniref:Alanine racemase n=1 Tax=Oceanobacillus piezotolerans TaxID=2448030 RepID=A0A498DH06_9BACI|nr:alanine racemase [Oceanobacillus piezotolerans]RLL47779.1 alanine racemase [Oceanobacillus piezotolerans]
MSTPFHALGNHHTIAEINLTTFRKNIKAIKHVLKQGTLIMAVIKTDAYGHGIIPIAQEAVRAGANRIGVTTVEEGVKLRKNGLLLPIHILSSIIPDQASDVVNYNLIAQVSTEDVAKALSTEAERVGKEATVHLKIDTGLHRFGMNPNETLPFCKKYYSLSGLCWEGIYTHFSSADEGEWNTTEQQYRLFMNTVAQLEEAGYTFPIKHVGASTIAIEREDMHLDMVRPGIALFGYHPSLRQEKQIMLEPVMSLKSKLIHLKTLAPNTKVGYGGKYSTTKTEQIGIISIGHGDGYKRGLSNIGKVIVNGKEANIIGTISLDQTLINVTEIPNLTIGDEVILIGKQGEKRISARDIANWLDSNVDEVLASIMVRVLRVYIT